MENELEKLEHWTVNHNHVSFFRYMVVEPKHRNFHPWYLCTWQYGKESLVSCWKASLQGHHVSHYCVKKEQIRTPSQTCTMRHDFKLNKTFPSLLRSINSFSKSAKINFARWVLWIVFVLALTYTRSIWLQETFLIHHMRPCSTVSLPSISNHVLHTDQPAPAHYLHSNFCRKIGVVLPTV